MSLCSGIFEAWRICCSASAITAAISGQSRASRHLPGAVLGRFQRAVLFYFAGFASVGRERLRTERARTRPMVEAGIRQLTRLLSVPFEGIFGPAARQALGFSNFWSPTQQSEGGGAA